MVYFIVAVGMCGKSVQCSSSECMELELEELAQPKECRAEGWN
jgi:hypothetical protein